MDYIHNSDYVKQNISNSQSVYLMGVEWPDSVIYAHPMNYTLRI